MSINFPPAILGPRMAAPILWAPGIFGSFSWLKPHAHKIPRFRGVVGISGKGPDLPFLAFLDFLAFLLFKEFLVFFDRFPLLFPVIVGVRRRRKFLVFFGGFPCVFSKKKRKGRSRGGGVEVPILFLWARGFLR